MADSDFLDVISFRQRGDGKPFAHRIGSAKHGKDGKLNVYLDSLPLPDKDGRVSLLISPRQERTGTGGGGYGARRTERPAPKRQDDFDDNDAVPF